jgi:demethylmenaquinone methyltransferase/2-methoxy-6-polyprenyl-1,4-benzoquinol methylase
MTKDMNSSQPGGPSRVEAWQMFDRIAGRYDFLNRLLSLRQDVRWRKKVLLHLLEKSDQMVLDVATGTGDVLLTLFSGNPKLKRGIGLDMAREMLKSGRQKIHRLSLDKKLLLIPGDSLWLPFSSQSFDVITIAFGIRNLIDIKQGLTEMFRVLKPGGRLLILEFSLPRNKLFRKIYLFYFRKILPWLGGVISGDRYAYRYLNQTVESFPYGKAFNQIMEAAGFQEVIDFPLSFGITSIYRGDRIG